MKLIYFSWIRERLDIAEEEAELPETVKTLGDLLAWQKSRGEEFEAVFARHHHIEETDVHLVEAERFDGLLAVIGDDHLVIVHGKELGKRLGIFSIVVDN